MNYATCALFIQHLADSRGNEGRRGVGIGVVVGVGVGWVMVGGLPAMLRDGARVGLGGLGGSGCVVAIVNLAREARRYIHPGSMLRS